MSTKTLLTADDLEQMPDDDSVQIELDEGELIRMPPAGDDHSYVEGELHGRLWNFVKEHNLGRVFTGAAGFRLRDDTVRSPDVAFVRREKVGAVRRQGFFRGAPDLAVEIVSPSNSFRQLTRKVKQYFAAGCHTVWIVDPERKEVDVFEATGADRTLGTQDALECPELLPGFSVKVAELFDS
jgi:Uma2 family endonuclease